MVSGKNRDRYEWTRFAFTPNLDKTSCKSRPYTRTQAEKLEHAGYGRFVLDLGKAGGGNIEIIVTFFGRDNGAGVLHFAQTDLQSFPYRFKILALV